MIRYCLLIINSRERLRGRLRNQRNTLISPRERGNNFFHKRDYFYLEIGLLVSSIRKTVILPRDRDIITFIIESFLMLPRFN
jgi:hypothetical protein